MGLYSRSAASAEEALIALRRETPDILISDIGMPEEDGLLLIRRIRALPDNHAMIPAIALSAYVQAEDRIKAIQSGFQLHLSKPIEPLQVVTMVRSLARRFASCA
jgi:CheY-like chemotaxis protein